MCSAVHCFGINHACPFNNHYCSCLLSLLCDSIEHDSERYLSRCENIPILMELLKRWRAKTWCWTTHITSRSVPMPMFGAMCIWVIDFHSQTRCISSFVIWLASRIVQAQYQGVGTKCDTSTGDFWIILCVRIIIANVVNLAFIKMWLSCDSIKSIQIICTFLLYFILTMVINESWGWTTMNIVLLFISYPIISMFGTNCCYNVML